MRRHRMAFPGLVLVTLSLTLVVGLALAQGTPTIDRYVIGGGGGHAEATPYALDGTLGQSVVGTASQGDYGLCSGFWCGAAVEYKIYLPSMLKNNH